MFLKIANVFCYVYEPTFVMQNYKGCYVFGLCGSKLCELFKKEKQVDTVKVVLWKKRIETS